MEEIAAASDPTRGKIRIGAAEPLTVVLSEIFGEMARKYPRIRYSITISDGDSLNRALREHKLNIVFRRWLPSLDGDDLKVDVVMRQALGVLAERRHLLLRRRKL